MEAVDLEQAAERRNGSHFSFECMKVAEGIHRG